MRPKYWLSASFSGVTEFGSVDGVELPPHARALRLGRLPHRAHLVVVPEVAQEVQHFVEVGDHPGLGERDQGRDLALAPPCPDRQLQLAERDAVRRQPDDLALDLVAPAEAELVLVDDVALLVHHFERDGGRLGVAVALDVGEQRVAAVAHGPSRVEHQVHRIGQVPPPRRLIREDRRAHAGRAEARRREARLGAAFRGRADVPHGDAHGVRARHQAQHLLEQDALVAPERLLEGRHPDDFLARHVHRRRALALEPEAHAVARDEHVALALKRERPVLERQAEDADDAVGGPGGERDGTDERQRIARGQPAELLVELRGIEDAGEAFGRRRLVAAAAHATPAAATEDGRADGGGDHETTHAGPPVKTATPAGMPGGRRLRSVNKMRQARSLLAGPIHGSLADP